MNMTEVLTKAVLAAAAQAGTEPEARKSKRSPLVDYLTWMAIEHPTAFATLLVEIIRKELEIIRKELESEEFKNWA